MNGGDGSNDLGGEEALNDSNFSIDPNLFYDLEIDKPEGLLVE